MKTLVTINGKQAILTINGQPILYVPTGYYTYAINLKTCSCHVPELYASPKATARNSLFHLLHKLLHP